MQREFITTRGNKNKHDGNFKSPKLISDEIEIPPTNAKIWILNKN